MGEGGAKKIKINSNAIFAKAGNRSTELCLHYIATRQSLILLWYFDDDLIKNQEHKFQFHLPYPAVTLKLNCSQGHQKWYETKSDSDNRLHCQAIPARVC